MSKPISLPIILAADVAIWGGLAYAVTRFLRRGVRGFRL